MTSMALSASTDRKSSPFLPAAVTLIGAVCVWKIFRRCCVRVHPKCVTVVFETRRRTILATSADKEQRSPSDDTLRLFYTRPSMYVVAQLLYRSSSRVVVPPTSFFSTFTLPRAVLDPDGEGEALDCTVEDVRVKDGFLRLVLTLRYCIPPDQLERYLAAIGPTPPNECIAIATAAAAKARGAELSVGLVINKAKRDVVFLEPFKEHLAAKLLSTCAVRLLDVIVESVEMIDKQDNK